MSKTVMVLDTSDAACNSASGAAGIVPELVLYDPEEHRAALLAEVQDGSYRQPHADATLPPKSGASKDTGVSLAGVGDTVGAATPLLGGTGPSLTHQQQQQSLAVIRWEQRVRVVADPFLAEKLRPHQREGVKCEGRDAVALPNTAAAYSCCGRCMMQLGLCSRPPQACCMWCPASRTAAC